MKNRRGLSLPSRRRVLSTLAGTAAGALVPQQLWSIDLESQSVSAPTLPTPIRFEEIAARAGLNFTTRNCATPNKNQIETMVAGVALLDYDGDGFLDVFLVNGAEIPFLQKTSSAYWNRLFRNNRDGSFTDVTE
mgnify:FL=1